MGVFAGFVLCCWRGGGIAGSILLLFVLLGERSRGIALCCIVLSEDEICMFVNTPALTIDISGLESPSW